MDQDNHTVSKCEIDKVCDEANARIEERLKQAKEMETFIEECKSKIECNNIASRQEEANIKLHAGNIYRQKEVNTSRWLIKEKEKENLVLKKQIEEATKKLYDLESGL